MNQTKTNQTKGNNLSEMPDDSKDDLNEQGKTFSEHLEDLRWVLIKSIITFVIASIICFYFSNVMFDVLRRPLVEMQQYMKSSQMIELRALHPSEAFLMSLKIAFASGLILSSPVILFFFWQFLSPGLTDRERKLALPAFASGLICFLVGVGFCYFVILKLCLLFFWKYTVSMGVKPEWTIGNYISFVITLLIAFGVTFEMPVLSSLLARLGLVNSRMLASKRGYSILAIFILAAILTPPDVFSQILLALPMIGLYEISILAAKVMESDSNANAS